MTNMEKLPIEQIPKDFRNWWLCNELKLNGFPQLRRFQCMYYILPDMLICIDDISALKRDGNTDWEDIFRGLVFKPRIEDLLANMPYFHELVTMNDGTVFAYSMVEEDPEYIAETGRTDKFVRARGADVWEALVFLYIAVAKRFPRRTLTPEELETSENKIEST